MAVGPVDDDGVGHREPRSRGEHLPGVAHRHLVTEDLGDTRERGGEVDGAEDDHAGRRREGLDERGDGLLAGLAVLAVVTDAGDARRQFAERVARYDTIEVGIAERAHHGAVVEHQQLRADVRSFHDGDERGRTAVPERTGKGVVDHRPATTAARCSRAATEWPSTKSSTYGSAAPMPRASGS